MVKPLDIVVDDVSEFAVAGPDLRGSVPTVIVESLLFILHNLKVAGTDNDYKKELIRILETNE